MEKPNSPLYLTTLEVIANILIRLWLVIGVLMANSILDGLMYQSENPMLQTEVSPEMLDKLTPRQLETISATQTANQLLSGMESKAKLSDVSDFMTHLAMQESQLGKQSSGVSYSPFQIDPIGYQDFVERAQGGYAKERVDFVNI